MDVNPHSTELLENLGATCGHLCNALKDFEQPAAHRYFKWNNEEINWITDSLEYIKEGEKRDLGKSN